MASDELKALRALVETLADEVQRNADRIVLFPHQEAAAGSQRHARHVERLKAYKEYEDYPEE